MAITGGEGRRKAAEGGEPSGLKSFAAPRRPSAPLAAHIASTRTRTPGMRLATITISGPRRSGRSASRPAMSFTNAAAASAAPSSAPSAAAPPPSTPVTNAGSSGYTISLAKSLRRETAPNSLTCLGSRLLTQAESPADQRDGETAVRQDGVVESAQREVVASRLPKIVAQPEQLAPPDGVAELIGGPGAVAPYFRLRIAALHVQLVHHLIDRLLAGHAARMKADVQQNAHRAPQQVHALEEQLLVGGVEALLTHHVFAVQRPAFDRQRRPQVLPDV